MSQAPGDKKNRKRARQVNFDLNRSTPFVFLKTYKSNTPSRKPSECRNLEMSQNQNPVKPQIHDKSLTIMATNPGTSSAAFVAYGAQQTSRSQRNMTEMEEPSEKVVDQGVSSQMSEMRRQMAELTATVSKMSLVLQHTQQENKKLREEIAPNVLKSSHNTYNSIDESPRSSGHSSRISLENAETANVRNYNKMRIDKWGLEFDGNCNKLPVEDFVFRVERLQRQYNTSWSEVLDNFHLFVKGAAEKWYWLFIRTNYVSEWTTLKEALLQQYQSTRSSFELISDLVERKQQVGEDIDSFFFVMIQMRSRLDISMPEREIIKIIKKNLRDDIRSRVYPINVNSVEELRRECIQAEKIFGRKDQKTKYAYVPSNRYSKHINEIVEKSDDEDNDNGLVEFQEDLAAIQLEKTKTLIRTPILCWNCRQNGHVFVDCPSPQRALFCYKCGKADVIAPNCTNCQARNFCRSEGTAGSHRTNENPPTGKR